MSQQITFIIADNQDITALALHAIVTEMHPEAVAIDVHDKRQLIDRLATAEGKTVVIIDYPLFNFNGIDNLLNIAHRFADANWDVFSAELAEGFIRRIALEKQFGIVMKDAPIADIKSSINAATDSQQYYSKEISDLLHTQRNIPPEKSVLTNTETDILRLMAQGKTAKEIASLRNSSIHTIITHKKNIFHKLEVNSTYEATKYAIRAGIAEAIEYYI